MRAIYPAGIVILSALLLAFLIGDAYQDSKSRRTTNDAIQVAKDWQLTAEKWEQVANRCVEQLESERR